MPPAAIADLKAYVKRVVLCPVPNPYDENFSRELGGRFVSRATMSMGSDRTLVAYPSIKYELPQFMAKTFTHETGHAIHAALLENIARISSALTKWWEEHPDIYMPASPKRISDVQEQHGLPRDPMEWSIYFSEWQRAAEEGRKITEELKNAEPVSDYARRNIFEYYAEAYMKFRYNTLRRTHIMYSHFKNLRKAWKWLKEQSL
jgi:hypothetical protein